MKRAKVLLAAIAIFGVVGGALAFKAKTIGNIYCDSACLTPVKLGWTTTNPGAASFTTVCNAQGDLYYKDASIECTSTLAAYETAN